MSDYLLKDITKRQAVHFTITQLRIDENSYTISGKFSLDYFFSEHRKQCSSRNKTMMYKIENNVNPILFEKNKFNDFQRPK
jgi:hypothetical protein